MGANARIKGASWLAIGVAAVSAIIGTIVWPPFGGIIASLLGIFIVEIVRLKELRKAVDSIKGMAQGCGWGFVMRVVAGLMMIFWWLFWVYVLPWINTWFNG